MTVEEFATLPEPRGGRYELRHGVPVFQPWPTAGHMRLRKRIYDLLIPLLPGSEVVTAFPFRPLAESEMWGADVAAVALDRWEATEPEAWLMGSPELVVHTSSFDTSDELDDHEQTAFAGGCKEFWVVFVRRQQVRVTTTEGAVRRYAKGDRIPAGQGAIAVDEIFSVLG